MSLIKLGYLDDIKLKSYRLLESLPRWQDLAENEMLVAGIQHQRSSQVYLYACQEPDDIQEILDNYHDAHWYITTKLKL